MRIAHIINGLVINISEGDLQETQALFPEQTIVEANDAEVGSSWDGAVFTPPITVSVNRPKIITRLAFRNRFTNAEKIALYTTAESNVQIKIYLDDINAATFVDLAREDTRIGVQTLETVGLLSSGRALEILDNPILDHERVIRS